MVRNERQITKIQENISNENCSASGYRKVVGGPDILNLLLREILEWDVLLF